jgi:hypothetical protein
VLDEAQCKTVGDVRQKSDRELRAIRGCGRWAIRRIRDACGYKAETETQAVPMVPSLRDHFAGLAMPMAFASYTEQRRADEDGRLDAVDFEDPLDMEIVAESCYQFADAMLKARQQ